MKFIGEKSLVCKPFAYMKGPTGDTIDVTNFTVSNTAGSISTANVGIIPDFFDKVDAKEQSNDLFEIFAGDRNLGTEYKVFSGYIGSTRPSLMNGKIGFAITLIHRARDLDQTSLFSPALHPSSIADYQYNLRIPSSPSDSADPTIISGLNADGWFSYTNSDPLAKQAISRLISYANDLVANIDETETVARIVNLKRSVALLQSVSSQKVFGVLSSDFPNYTSEIEKGINQMAAQNFIGSMQSARSVWAALTSYLSAFGIQIICDTEGLIVMPIVSGVRPPPENTINSDYSGQVAQTFNLNSNIAKCICVNVQAMSQITGKPLGKVPLGIFPRGTEGVETGEDGSTLVVGIPMWIAGCGLTISQVSANSTKTSESLAPVDGSTVTRNRFSSVKIVESRSQSSEQSMSGLAAAMDRYAKLQFYREKNRGRSLTVAGPLAPGVIPGTMCTVDVDLKVKPMYDKAPDATNATMYGYCYQIEHNLSVEAMSCQTTYFLSHVTEDPSTLIESPPFFTDTVPLKWT